MNNNTKDVMFSSNRDDWETPQSLFDKLDKEFNFTLDPCSSKKNHKCVKFYTEEDNGLERDWGGEIVFCNPPYSKKGGQDLWVEKCYNESLKPNTIVVALLPARTDTKRFHKFILGKAEIRWIEGRLNFEIDGVPVLDKNGKPSPAPFPSMICIWDSRKEK